MKTYLITLMAVALLNGIVGMISPEGDVKKYVRLLGTLCLLCALVQPVLGWIGEGEGFLGNLWELDTEEETQDYEEIYNQALLSGGKKNLEDLIQGRILQRFELPEGSVDVGVELERTEGAYTVGQVCLTLREAAVFADPRELVAYVNEQFSCPCTVVYS